MIPPNVVWQVFSSWFCTFASLENFLVQILFYVPSAVQFGSCLYGVCFSIWTFCSEVFSKGQAVQGWITCACQHTLPETNIAPYSTWKMMVGWILVSFWDGLPSGAMLVSGSVYIVIFHVQYRIHVYDYYRTQRQCATYSLSCLARL